MSLKLFGMVETDNASCLFSLQSRGVFGFQGVIPVVQAV